MNIKDAKDQIKNAMMAYFTKDEFGNYLIPIQKQRPVFLMGPPGIGKTAIMEQVASEMGVGLLSYSMTHHTRQSALGLPYIQHKTYGGKQYDISEYTMSEIIASVYDLMEDTGVREGILFLDEINCVSETLAPIMLQFLQYKVFGRHSVPDGWIVVTAGNPPEYNNSVRDFDIVTWDRLKRVDIEPDYKVWKEYAYQTGVHAAVTTYLEIRTGDFYKVESTVEGKTFVTARGWDDLSQMIILYERNGIKVDEKLVRQYIQNPKIAKNFAMYYDLYNKYLGDYQIDSILAGTVPEEIKERAKRAKFDERLSLLGLLLDGVTKEIKAVMSQDSLLKMLVGTINGFRKATAGTELAAEEVLSDIIEEKRLDVSRGRKTGSMSQEGIRRSQKMIRILEGMLEDIQAEKDPDAAYEAIKKNFNSRVDEHRADVQNAGFSLSNTFKFCEDVFPDGQEILILVTELTANNHAATFINKYGCKEYFRHNRDLLFYERQKEIDSVLEELDLG